MNVSMNSLPVILTTTKEGESENADFCNYIFKDGRVNSIAISDGATGCSFSNYLAQSLVKGFLCTENPKNSNKKNKSIIFNAFVETNKIIEKKISNFLNTNGLKSLLIIEKARKGACATFLGIQINYNNKTFYCLWIGDSCIFQIRAKKIIKALPNIKNFTNHPELLKSIMTRDEILFKSQNQNKWEYGDVFLLATDALAEWVVRNEGNEHWNKFLSYFVEKESSDVTYDFFYKWVVNKRLKKMIEDDDTTCCILRV